MSSKISVHVVICFNSFQSLVSKLPENASSRGPTPQLWQDALARFRIWSSNIGAHQKGQSSLDYRLRDASHIRDQILKVLVALRQNLLDAEEIIFEGEVDEGSASELEEVYSGIKKLLECLFQLSMRIRRPAPRDKILGRRKDDSKIFEHFDRRHIKDKFPSASDALVERLTTAVSKRRSNLKYFERHLTKLGKGLEVADNDAGDEPGTFYSSTLATTFRETPLDEIEKASTSYASETSYAPSFFLSDLHAPIPPIPPESADGSPFECPYCYIIITVSNPREWAKHVFQDLEPYVCVIEECSMPERLYKSRHEWTAHLCDSHQQSLSSSRCPLCTENCFANPQLQQHLRRHLEDLALFILPAADTTVQIPDPENVQSDWPSQDSDDAEPGGYYDQCLCKHCNKAFDSAVEDDGSCPYGRHESKSRESSSADAVLTAKESLCTLSIRRTTKPKESEPSHKSSPDATVNDVATITIGAGAAIADAGDQGSIATKERKGEHNGFGGTYGSPPLGMLPMVWGEREEEAEKRRNEIERNRNESEARNSRRMKIIREKEIQRRQALDRKKKDKHKEGVRSEVREGEEAAAQAIAHFLRMEAGNSELSKARSPIIVEDEESDTQDSFGASGHTGE